jgi:hypothetical protein
MRYKEVNRILWLSQGSFTYGDEVDFKKAVQDLREHVLCHILMPVWIDVEAKLVEVEDDGSFRVEFAAGFSKCYDKYSLRRFSHHPDCPICDDYLERQNLCSGFPDEYD